MTDKITMAVNAATAELRRVRALTGQGSIDAKRACNAWREYGYPTTVTFQMMYNLFRRGGVAHGAVSKLNGRCWSKPPYIVQGEERDLSKRVTPWEREVNTLPVWEGFAEAHKRAMVGRYSALILQLDDDEEYNQPVTSKRNLVSVMPVWASALQPGDTDILGNVKTWQYTGANQQTITIHPDRVFIVGDASPDAIGFLEPVFNNFINLEKVEGGSGESFLKNAARHLSIEYDKEIDLGNIAAMYGVSLDELHERFNEAVDEMNRGTDVALINQGAKVTPLVVAVSDPRPTYEVNIQSIASGTGIPGRILAMMQTGERASTEDANQFNQLAQSWCEGPIGRQIRQFIEHLVRIKVIRAVPRFIVHWDSLIEQTDGEKLENAKVMSEIETSVPGTFDSDEIRTAAGYDAREEALPDGEVEE